MRMKFFVLFAAALVIGATSCVSKKSLEEVQATSDQTSRDLAKCGEDLTAQMALVKECEQEKETLRGNIRTLQSTIESKDGQINDLRAQMEQRDDYIRMLQAAKTKADSINLVLSANLKGQLAQGIADNDIEVKVDKTVVFVNLSDKMVYESGSSNLTTRAKDVLAKIALIVQDREDLQVMVEGYTDNRPISRECFQDNWDLSTQRATSVVRVLQNDYGVDPNRLIAAGRGEYNMLASNDTPEGMALNRRTRIIILPKLDQFYDLLNPDMASK